MKIKSTLLLAFILSTLFCFSQGRNDNWFFGGNSGMTFTSGAPIALNNGVLFAEEGSSSISDASGNLLFYSDGTKVWNKNHIQMPNGFGLNGGVSTSSTQACLIIKQPGNTNIYYIFTVEENGGASGFRYSTVDINLSAGLGDVVFKNVLINTTTTEKLAAAYHCNGVDIWISAHDGSSNQFRSLLLSSAGLGASVTSTTGASITIDPVWLEMGPGSMKFSPNGNKLVLTNTTSPNLIQLFDFNKSTGVFSNPQTIFNIPSYTATFEGNYGAEFSPNSNVLYISDFNNVLQYDISSGIAATIIASRIVLGTPTTGNFGQLQLGPDGKIYSTESRNTFIGIINSPNTIGLGCNYNPAGLDLDPGFIFSNDLRLGLPSLLTTIPTKFTFTGGTATSATYCQGDPSTPIPSFVSSYPVTGLFSSSPGLSINATTGAINLAASTPNTYTVTFTATVTAGCVSPFFSTYTIIITPGVALCYTKRAAKWYMGNTVALNFLCASPPTPLDDCASTPAGNMENNVSISDNNGNLLFYAFNNVVMNRNHVIMPNGNGLNTDYSASQGFLPVPHPTNSDRYYLFTIGNNGSPGLHYSEIDLLADGGLGDVIPSSKNTFLLAGVPEHLTAVESCIAGEIWVIVHDANNMYSFRINASGISAPVISPSPISLPSSPGQLKASPTGRHIALSVQNSTSFLFTFDNETGKVCYKETLTHGGYGCSFSNNGQYFYANDFLQGIWQYNAYASNVDASGTMVYDPWVGGAFLYGGMHLAPDCKLYVFGSGQSMGTVINNPNLGGIACDVQPELFPLSNGSPSYSGHFASANYIQSWFKDPTYVEPVIVANYTYVTACLPSPTTFTNTSTHITECPTYSWNFGDPSSGVNNTSILENPTHIFSAPGTYSVTLTLTERCQTSIKIIPITVYGAPIVTIIADTTVCENFGVTLNTSSAGTYLWTGPSGNMSGLFTSTLQNPTNPVFLGDGFANEGWYYLTITNAVGCSATDSIYIHILAVPSPSVTSSIINCIQTLTATVGTSNGPIISYAWGPAGGSSLGTTSVINLPVGYPGPQVVLTVVDSESCGAGVIILTPPLVQPNVTAGAPLVLSCTTLSGNITASSTTPGATYSWTGAGVTAGGTTSSATVNAAGTYTVTVTNPANGCTVSATVAVTASATLPSPIIYTPNSWYCVGDNTTPLNSSSGDLWYSNPGLTTLVGTGLNFSPPTITGMTTYYVVDTSATCISAAASVTVEFTNCAAPACATNLLSNGGFDNYSTCPTNTQQVANAISWLGSGDYYNTICNGYYNSPSYFPYFNATNYTLGLAGGGVFPPPVGAGSAGLILGGTIFKSFIAQQINLGCSKEYTLQFRATAPRSDTPPDNSLCVYGSNTPPPYFGCSASLTLLACLPSPASINNFWTPQTITFTPTVNYSYMVLTGQCPTSTVHGGTVFIDDLFLCSTCTNPPVVNASESTPASCIAADGVGNASVIGCDGTYTFDWQNVTSLGTTVSTLSTPNNLAAGAYSVIVTDGGGCTGTSSVTITSSTTPPTVSAISSNNITCINLNSTLTGTSIGNTMVWNGGSLPLNSPNPAVVTAIGTYTVTATDAITGCTNTSTVAVTANTTPPAATTGAPLVLTCTTLSGNITASSLTPGATFNWTGAGITAGAATSTATVNAANTYTVTVTDPANGCTATTTVAVTTNTTPPTATAGLPLVLTCTTLSGNITASSITPGATFNWTGAGITAGAATSTATVNAANTYTVTVTNPANGCTATNTVAVTSNITTPNATSGPSQNISCITGLATLSANSTTVGATYAWTGAGITAGGSTSTPTVNLPGTYTVTVTDPTSSCTATSTVIVGINPGPTANSGLDVTITSGTSTTLTGTGGGSYLWNTGATTNSILVSPSVTTDYCVIVTDINGCSDSSCVRVNVDILCGDLFVPNAFSPNGDGFNDVFRIKINSDCVIDMQLLVFDRWGEKIIEITDPTQFWDGTFRGKQLDNAVFVYYLTLTLKNATDVIKQNGNVSLIK
jgi:gliding motility-associated-like protein